MPDDQTRAQKMGQVGAEYRQKLIEAMAKVYGGKASEAVALSPDEELAQYRKVLKEVRNGKFARQWIKENEKGQPETVAYQALAPLLLNELQKEHKRTEQETSDLRRQLDFVTAQLAELRQMTARLTAKK